ncbi:MAG: hypothetical protein AABP62_03900 [Planctomycetota bacterium]
MKRNSERGARSSEQESFKTNSCQDSSRDWSTQLGVSSTLRSALRAPRSALAPSRSGSVLLIVLVVIALLTLAAYNYTQTMLTELEATTMYGADVQARAAADSGVEYIATILANRTDPALENLIHNPNVFLGKTIAASDRLRGNARFTIISPVEQDVGGNAIRYGLMDESAKLNLNLLDKLALTDEQTHTLLMNVPNMTVEVIDAMLDWIDSNDTKRPSGAESEVYEALTPPYKAKNGPLESIDELLLVQGVTPALLYGEDANRNGLLDPNENDGDQSPPLDNADGVLDHGWVAFLTAHSREANRRADGRKKIYINNNLLTDLFDELEEEFGIETAKFLVAYRINGPVEQPPVSSIEVSDKAAEDAARKKAEQEALKKLVESITKNVLTKSGTVTRGGIDLSGGAKTTIKTIWELIDSKAAATVDGSNVILNNGGEWTAEDPSSMQTLLPKLMDALTTSEEDYIDGRINLNQARPEILKGLPGMDEELWNKIILAQKLDAGGQPDPDTIQRHNTAGWLLAEGLVDKWKMRELDPYLTARGSVFRAQVFGFFDGGGPVTRLEVMVDSTKNPPRVTFQRDLNGLGHGYARGQLLPVTK